MAPLTATIHSFSSEDSMSKAENVLNTNNSKWLCSKCDVGAELNLTLKLDTPSRINHINIGNHGCASIDIKVGKSTWSKGRPYELLLPNVTLMSPAECKDWIHTTKVFMFNKATFVGHNAQKSWDCIKVSCRQPFEKQRQFGLEFLDLRGVSEKDKHQKTDDQNINFKEKDAEELKNIIKKAVDSSGGSSEGRLNLSRTQKCLENALIKARKSQKKRASFLVNSFSHDEKKKTVERALLRQKNLLNKFNMEVECFLNAMDITNMNLEMTKVSDLRHHIEKMRGVLLSKEERKAFFEMVGRRINNMKFPEAPDGSAVNFNQSLPPGKGQSKLLKKLAGEEMKKSSDEIRMRRRSINIKNNSLLYGGDTLEPPKKLHKEDPIEIERSKEEQSHQDIDSEIYLLPKKNCLLCGKIMSEVTLRIHMSFCQGKSEFESEQQEKQDDLCVAALKGGQQQNPCKMNKDKVTILSESNAFPYVLSTPIGKTTLTSNSFTHNGIDSTLATDYSKEWSISIENQATCPICCKKFLTSYINSHVNHCLDSSDVNSVSNFT